MLNKRSFCVLVITVFLGLSGLWAGDTATFVDLGFSPDGKTYMFAQYGIQSGTLKPWADLFVVDVVRNNFVSGGRFSYVHDKPVVSGQDGSGALYRIITQNVSIANRYRINYCFQGQPLYIGMDTGDPADTAVPIEFRDFDSGANYRASLVATVEGTGAALKSSFHIDLERTGRDGARKTYTVGTPQLKRPFVGAYRIRKVMTAPRDGSIIFVIEMRIQESGETNLRFMVEALRL